MKKILLSLIAISLVVPVYASDRHIGQSLVVKDTGVIEGKGWDVESFATSDTLVMNRPSADEGVTSESGKLCVISSSSTPTITLDDAATGLHVLVVAKDAYDFKITPQSGDKFLGVGSALTFDAGDTLFVTSAATSDSVELIAISSSEWLIVNSVGTLTNGG